MTIKITYAGTDYSIHLDGTCYTLVRHGINTDKKSAKYGQPTEYNLGYFTSFPNSVHKIVKDGLGSSEEVLTITEFIGRYEAAKEAINEQLKEVE